MSNLNYTGVIKGGGFVSKHFWELDLDEIPLGWEKIHKYALENIPEGKVYKSEIEDIHGDTITEELLYDPVGYKKVLYRLFNEYKVKAKGLWSSRNLYDPDLFSDNLLELDAILHHILYNWCRFGELDDIEFYDSKDIERQILTDSVQFYLDSLEFDGDFEDKYNEYKAINNTDYLEEVKSMHEASVDLFFEELNNIIENS